MTTDDLTWIPLSTTDYPLPSASAGLARLQEDLDQVRGVGVPELGITLGEFVTGAWAWCPDGPELPRAVMVAWGLSLPPVPGLGKLVESGLTALESTPTTGPDPQWGAPAIGRQGSSVWSADLDYPMARPGQVDVGAPSGTVLTVWRQGWPVDVGGTVTTLAPGWDPQGRLPDIVALAEATRNRSVARPSAGGAVLDWVQGMLEGRADAAAATRVDGPARLLELARSLSADPVHPRAAGVFRLAPVSGRWWPPAAERAPAVLPPPPAPPTPVREAATAVNLPPSAVSSPSAARGSSTGGSSAGAAAGGTTGAGRLTRSRSRGNAGRTPRRGGRRGGRKPVSRRGAGGTASPSAALNRWPTDQRAVLPTLVVATLVAFAISFAFQRAVAAKTMEADSGFALTVWGLGMFLGPVLAIWGGVLLGLRRHIVGGRWLLGLGALGIELFLALSLVATQAGERVF